MARLANPFIAELARELDLEPQTTRRWLRRWAAGVGLPRSAYANWTLSDAHRAEFIRWIAAERRSDRP